MAAEIDPKTGPLRHFRERECQTKKSIRDKNGDEEEQAQFRAAGRRARLRRAREENE